MMTIGSKITLIIAKDNLEAIGLINKDTSHMILFKNKKRLAHVEIDYNYYERKLQSLNTSKKLLEETIKRDEAIINSNIKLLILINMQETLDYTLYIFKYFDQFGEEQYATYRVNNEEKEKLLKDPIIEDTTLKGKINGGSVTEIVTTSYKRVKKI